ncbi:DNA/RNA nuclease SfsA [Nitratiruptor sp. SB155-2]|uniref:DNA/RNA nuclease SfsA n=1 Tax=Nitratiruptor sp. (strain SB155-2) TaxID=387092 RepID=UPI0001587402|nr:DNA/RNA nuclease SfsA [Nitratiruptor sp. SB155-2]BAF70776.1 sugar fermentation stimulation protein [Nitratiruptor sp. SB155-2]
MILFDLTTLGELTTGSLIKRQNRFLATAFVDNQVKKVHIADTGRLEEILTPNRALLLLKNRPGLKTDYTLIAAKMEEGWVLINTKLHRPIAQKAIKQGVLGFIPKTLQAEVLFENSRLDFKADDAFIELKGCSLVQDNLCLFPNAPTSRGVKHIRDLIKAKEKGFNAYILIMAVRKCACFKPHPTRDLEFQTIFFKALQKGVRFKGFFIRIDSSLHVVFDGPLTLCHDKI